MFPHVVRITGGHFCVGAALARSEMSVALPRLAQCYPDLAPAFGPQGPQYQPAVVMKSLRHIPVTLGERAG